MTPDEIDARLSNATPQELGRLIARRHDQPLPDHVRDIVHRLGFATMDTDEPASADPLGTRMPADLVRHLDELAAPGSHQ